MANLLLWSGLTSIVALTPALGVVGLHPKEGILVIVGAVLMVLGCIGLWIGRPRT